MFRVLLAYRTNKKMNERRLALSTAAAIPTPRVREHAKRDHTQLDAPSVTGVAISVMTFNVQAYVRASPQQIGEFIQQQQPDIVFLQEDVVPLFDGGWDRHAPGYVVAAQCIAEPLTSGTLETRYGSLAHHRLANTILVRAPARPTVAPTSQESRESFYEIRPLLPIDIQESCCVERCAAAAIVDDVVVANVHLCGGRFDSRHFERLQDVKRNEINTLMRAIEQQTGRKPHIVAGDFNAESSLDAAMQTLPKYSLFTNLRTDAERQAFLRYYLGAGDALRQAGLQPAFTEAQVGATSEFGGVPDWIYIDPARLRVTQVSVLRTIPLLSDHNAVLVCLAKR